MQRRTSRTLSRAVVVAVVLAVGATIWQSWTAGTPGMAGVVQTTWGPLSPADRDLIVKVRLACLWEMSTGQQMQQQATSPAVREAGRKISLEHTELDQKTRDIADKLGVLLPSTPSAQQIGWMKEITSATGSDYDRIAVQRLRQAHGIVLPLLSTVRVGTRNDLVRAFAIDGSLYVNRHLTYLEQTGLVNYPDLPETPSPGLLSGSVSWTDLIVPGLVLIACLLVAVALGSTLRGRGQARRAALGVTPVARPTTHIATAKSLLALPGTPLRLRRDVTEVTEAPDTAEDDRPTGHLPRIGGTGSFVSVSSPSTTGEFSASAQRIAATGGFPSPRTPGRGTTRSDATGVTDTGPRHAVRR